MIKNNDDLNTQKLIKSISAIFQKIENIITNLNDDENHVITINESFELLNNYEKMLPQKYKKFFFNHFDGLISDFTNTIVSSTSKNIANKEKIETLELIKSIRFAIRSLQYLLSHYDGSGKRISIINALIRSLEEYKDIVPKKHHESFLRHFNYLKNEFEAKRNPGKINILKQNPSRHPVYSFSRNAKGDTDIKSKRRPKQMGYGVYLFYKSNTKKNPADPFRIKRLRGI